jgi:tRNA(Arg) A34 adenosine deaminase TadA
MQCASAIRWTGFREVVFGSRRTDMVGWGWDLISISTEELFERSHMLQSRTKLLGGVLRNETDAYFRWQYDGKVECPVGCRRQGAEEAEEGGRCVKV